MTERTWQGGCGEEREGWRCRVDADGDADGDGEEMEEEEQDEDWSEVVLDRGGG